MDGPVDKELKELRFRVEELEMRNDKLRIDLIEEKEKRKDVEAKFCAIEDTRERVTFPKVRTEQMVS